MTRSTRAGSLINAFRLIMGNRCGFHRILGLLFINSEIKFSVKTNNLFISFLVDTDFGRVAGIYFFFNIYIVKKHNREKQKTYLKLLPTIFLI